MILTHILKWFKFVFCSESMETIIEKIVTIIFYIILRNYAGRFFQSRVMSFFIACDLWRATSFSHVFWNIRLLYVFTSVQWKQNIKSDCFVFYFTLFTVFWPRWKMYLFPYIFICTVCNLWYYLWIFFHLIMLCFYCYHILKTHTIIFWICCGFFIF